MINYITGTEVFLQLTITNNVTNQKGGSYAYTFNIEKWKILRWEKRNPRFKEDKNHTNEDKIQFGMILDESPEIDKFGKKLKANAVKINHISFPDNSDDAEVTATFFQI